ncbi:hypothetical protein F2Q70_00022694 [Brassica cretica]|uniref:Uncharacterized protein n=1 Tax=Brassica cretica TaxID=69181 RepID=A0A8S9GR97_BRACR|nr:hypothetical protein F2Q70_00022694 [Brassica cretica]
MGGRAVPSSSARVREPAASNPRPISRPSSSSRARELKCAMEFLEVFRDICGAKG